MEGIHKSYRAHRVLRNINLTLPPGVVGLLGPNGSGKSTLIKAILGLVSVDAGRGRVLQFSWPEQSRALRDQIGYLPEDDCYLQGLQGIESIQMIRGSIHLRFTTLSYYEKKCAGYCLRHDRQNLPHALVHRGFASASGLRGSFSRLHTVLVEAGRSRGQTQRKVPDDELGDDEGQNLGGIHLKMIIIIDERESECGHRIARRPIWSDAK